MEERKKKERKETVPRPMHRSSPAAAEAYTDLCFTYHLFSPFFNSLLAICIAMFMEMPICTCLFIHVFSKPPIHVYPHVSIELYVSPCLSLCLYLSVSIHVCLYLCLPLNTPIPIFLLKSASVPMYLCAYLHLHADTYTNYFFFAASRTASTKKRSVRRR